MRKLSTGVDSTLGNWLDLAITLWGKESKAVKFLEETISKSPNGRDEEVIVEECCLLHALSSIAFE